MFATKDAIEKDILTINFDQSLQDALSKMEEIGMHQIVVVHESVAEGILHWEDIYELPDLLIPINAGHIRDKNVGINGSLHLFEAAKLIASNSWEVLPVLDAEMKYAGSLRWDTVFEMVTNMMAVNLSGSVIVLRRLAIDYSMAEISRICESNDARIISSGIMQEEGTSAVIVTIKLNKNEIGGIIAAFERYEYEVLASFGDDEYKDYLKDRYDLLMNYLNM